MKNTAAPPRVPTTIPNFISQEDNNINEEDHDSEPVTQGYNTRSKTKQFTGSITRDSILSAIEMSFEYERPEPSRLAQRRFPLKTLCDIAGAVLDGDTGELLEYRQLVKMPKYKQTWGRAFGNKIGRLAPGIPGPVEGTNTFYSSSSRMTKYPQTEDKMSHTAEFVAMYDQKRSTNQTDAELLSEGIESTIHLKSQHQQQTY